MTKNDIIGLVITSIIGLLFIALSLILLSGKGSFLIAGYNTLSKEEKEKFDDKKLCRFIGKILLPIGLLTPFAAVCGIYDIGWFPSLYAIVIIALSIFTVIYCNTGNRFRK